jgi:hypothetical protein
MIHSLKRSTLSELDGPKDDLSTHFSGLVISVNEVEDQSTEHRTEFECQWDFVPKLQLVGTDPILDTFLRGLEQTQVDLDLPKRDTQIGNISQDLQSSQTQDNTQKGELGTGEQDEAGGIPATSGAPTRGGRDESPTRQELLSRALAKANSAVLLDNSQNVEGAIEAYVEACDTIQRVIKGSSNRADRKKLSAIRTSYSNRIAELHNVDYFFSNRLENLEDPLPVSENPLLDLAATIPRLQEGSKASTSWLDEVEDDESPTSPRSASIDFGDFGSHSARAAEIDAELDIDTIINEAIDAAYDDDPSDKPLTEFPKPEKMLGFEQISKKILSQTQPTQQVKQTQGPAPQEYDLDRTREDERRKSSEEERWLGMETTKGDLPNESRFEGLKPALPRKLSSSATSDKRPFRPVSNQSTSDP